MPRDHGQTDRLQGYDGARLSSQLRGMTRDRRGVWRFQDGGPVAACGKLYRPSSHRSRAFSHTSLTVPGCQLQGQKRNIRDTLFSGERLSSTLTLKKSLFGYFASLMSLPAREIAIRHVLKRAQCHFRSGQSRTSQEEGRGRPNEKHRMLGRNFCRAAHPGDLHVCPSPAALPTFWNQAASLLFPTFARPRLQAAIDNLLAFRLVFVHATLSSTAFFDAQRGTLITHVV